MEQYITSNQRNDLKQKGFRISSNHNCFRVHFDNRLIVERAFASIQNASHLENLAYAYAANYHLLNHGILVNPIYTPIDLAYSLVSLQRPLIARVLKGFDFNTLSKLVEVLEVELMQGEQLPYPKQFSTIRDAAVRVASSQESEPLKAVSYTVHRMQSFLTALRSTKELQSYEGVREVAGGGEANEVYHYSVLGLLRLFVAQTHSLKYEDLSLISGISWLMGMLNIKGEQGNASKVFNMPAKLVERYAQDIGSSWVNFDDGEMESIPIVAVSRELELSFPQVADLLDVYWFGYGTDNLIIDTPSAAISLSLVKGHLESQVIFDTVETLEHLV